MGGISITQLLIIAAIIILLFGTKKLSSLGADLGASIKGFKKAMDEENDKATSADESSKLPSSLSEHHLNDLPDETYKKDK
ncbi:Sec-independent protein translocase subunit TatA [Yersinia enterocolitica]|jgi:sec-independent protein translocase protein TatA|uniref:Sec-independent protein translocase subunit TatA n=1 Tax=Pectobacterium TaxID=122277 RepID=UPI000DE791B1|nr:MULTISPECIES: Sec-independent protein translocase subunit TatA [Pectobacterium]EKN6378125.1 twin-arginine translocase TatA/TatE family subunit [Yersinia enterocolitica]MBA0207711.1 Sec-independent protein translocase subunit TatA [Pectobacterium brasiliense]MCA6938413.1 Sec-independent protein translocase subunit TatA [Pectobacterium versatile]PVY71191.1 sec-independent protein translocase protein TatA [Pectobacterium versatile]ULS46283.1 twin-arginine translocase TatA/TatE family subunit [